MQDSNQGFVDDERLDPPPLPPAVDLRPWLAIVTVAGLGALIAGQTELAALTALAGLFAVAHAADLDASRDAVYRALAWVVPAGCAIGFGSLGMLLWQADLSTRERAVGVAAAGVGAAFSLAAGFRPVARELARTLFNVEEPSRVMRLAARLAVLATLFSIPAGLAFPVMVDQMGLDGASLVGGAAGLWGNLVAMVLLALGGVGFLVRRGWSATMDRLGLLPLSPRDGLAVLAGVAGIILVNAGAEWVQRHWFPGLWLHDQRINQMIAGNLSRPETLLLGLSAGFGEEVALRGALQPRLGVFRTSMLFALLHVQYSWFGMLIIALLGLALGWIRRRTSTSVAIAVHGIYDVAAVLTVGS